MNVRNGVDGKKVGKAGGRKVGLEIDQEGFKKIHPNMYLGGRKRSGGNGERSKSQSKSKEPRRGGLSSRARGVENFSEITDLIKGLDLGKRIQL